MGVSDRDYMKRPPHDRGGKSEKGSREANVENFLNGFLDRHPNFPKQVVIALTIFFVAMLSIVLLLKN